MWRFNPCFSGSGALATIKEKLVDQIPWVSILVFLDLALWLRTLQPAVTRRPSFNPCFSGSGALANWAGVPSLSGDEFQSLFFWIWRSGPLSRCRKVRRRRGFNPCFSGSGALASDDEALSGGGEPVSILVFLDLALWPRGGRFVDHSQHCFNPCFSGSGALAACPEFARECLCRFQSLFFWIWRSGSGTNTWGSNSEARFQSLFFWIWRSGPGI